MNEGRDREKIPGKAEKSANMPPNTNPTMNSVRNPFKKIMKKGVRSPGNVF